MDLCRKGFQSSSDMNPDLDGGAKKGEKHLLSYREGGGDIGGSD